MSTFNSSVYLKNAVYRPTSVDDDLEIVASITIPNGTGLATNDILNFCWVGENVNVQSFIVETSDLDGGTSLVWDLGNTSDPNCFLSGSTIGRSAGEIDRRSTDATAGNQFAVTPYVVQTTPQAVFATITTGPASNPATDRTITLKLNLFYALPDTELIGLTGVSSTNLLGTKVYVAPTVYTYGGQAP